MMRLRVEIPHDKETDALRMTGEIEERIRGILEERGIQTGDLHVQFINQETAGALEISGEPEDILLDNDAVDTSLEHPDGLGKEY